ncbi:CotH kinase family protein [Puniceicoccaceae bacterium K14]|nr:CotH kinase family protein [Puniceicoccaceae bacterium K14]
MSSPQILRRYLYPLLAAISTFCTNPSNADEADAFFDDSFVHEIRLTFDDDNWYSTLYNSHANDPDDPYFPAAFVGDGVEIGTIGVRFKGNSSFNINSIKKSIKLDFDEYDEENEDLTFFGLKKLNLNNGFKDPTMLREKVMLDFASQFVPTIRAVHTRVYINDEYIGLYVAIEQVDKTFVQDRFGSGEDGNLYKGAASDDVASGPQSDFGSDLTWEGSEESDYYERYQLKTNEEENDYSGLVEFVDVLNNGDPDTFPETLEPLLDVDNALASMALNNLFMNLDSYSGSAHNYYVYQSDTTGQFSHVFWDVNETFGSFTLYWSGTSLFTTDPFWHPTTESRPLMEQLWENEEYAKRYLSFLARMLREGFDADAMVERIEKLADIIRADLYADNNKQYTNANFETNLYSSVSSGRESVYGLGDFIEARAAYLESELDSYADVTDLRINELLVKNDGSYLDTTGDSDPWMELYNPGLGTVSLSGLYLSNSTDDKTQWALPNVDLSYGEFLTFWIDGEASEGNDHSSFSLSETGGTLYLYGSDGGLIDSVSYNALNDGFSYGRYPDGEDNLIFSNDSSPGEENRVSTHSSVSLFINEVLAENDAVLQDPAGTGFPDWFELYNPNDYAINLGGMYLTDDSDLPTQWRIPDDLKIEANGFLLIWADNDEEQGSNHANFKISSGGEEIALYDTDENGNVLIDHIEFGEQVADVSYGRDPDGSNTFTLYDVPTPGATNAGIDYTLEITSQLLEYNVGEGYSITLSVDVVGVGPYSYQWRLNGSDISGETNATLSLDSIGVEQAGIYRVYVTNGNSTVVGSIAEIEVDGLDPDGDADGDGVSNIVESAFGMNANAADASDLPAFVYGNDAVSYTFFANRDDIDYIFESSVDLIIWENEGINVSDVGESYFYHDYSDSEKRFYRLRLEVE